MTCNLLEKRNEYNSFMEKRHEKWTEDIQAKLEQSGCEHLKLVKAMSRFLKSTEFFDHLSNCQMIKKDLYYGFSWLSVYL
jgi:hypothetical protein